MEWLFLSGFGVLLAVVLSAGLLRSRAENRSFERALRNVDPNLGLQVSSSGASSRPHAQARHGSQRVLVTLTTTGRKSSNLVTRIQVDGGQPPEVLLAAENPVGNAFRVLGFDDVHTGDAVFDDAVIVNTAEERDVLARLDAPARKAVRAAVSQGGRLEKAAWVFEERGRLLDSARLTFLITLGLEAARALDRTAGPAEDGLRALLDDPEPGVRTRAARLLGLPHADAGSLSLAEAAGGELSTTGRGPTGALSED